MAQANIREQWVDHIKVFACMLVVVGHFWQSMVKAEILSENDLFLWFNQTIYMFHVPLFFICSGYLYQRYSRVSNFTEWKVNVKKKLLILGVPYFVFSTLTWILKNMFSNAVNEQTGGLLHVLLISPQSPYWYLYCLLFIFIFIPTFRNKRISLMGFIAAILLKVFSIAKVGMVTFVISSLCDNAIWFVLGMILSMENIATRVSRKWGEILGVGLFSVFLLGSVVIYIYPKENLCVKFVLGLVACVSVVLLMLSNKKISKSAKVLSKYTMPIFLMHTIFAACLRIVLLKIGITNAFVHIFWGIVISLVGPMAVAWIMGKIKWMDFLLYPTRYVKI